MADLLPYRHADGPWQMAADEVMLERACAGESSLRFYAWDPPTVSLGYFQKHEERLANPTLAAYPWVRRCTGGGAIIHDQDLTYAFALAADALAGLSPLEWHNRFHHALADILGRHQVAAQVLGGPRKPQAELDYLCFAVPQPGDVVLEGRKIIGGAQRLRRGALLQHGSMQWRHAEAITDTLSGELADALGFQLFPRNWSAEELLRIDSLSRTKYGHDAWNKKR
jgi:lipoate-protein ligase A